MWTATVQNRVASWTRKLIVGGSPKVLAGMSDEGAPLPVHLSSARVRFCSEADPFQIYPATTTDAGAGIRPSRWSMRASQSSGLRISAIVGK
jgi:hypothetical protein